MGISGKTSSTDWKQKIDEAKEWVGQHKPELVVCGVGISFVLSVCLMKKYYLREIAWRDLLISKQHNRIIDLENLCEVKDKFFKEIISDGLRNRSRLAAQHMADLKHRLSNINVA